MSDDDPIAPIHEDGRPASPEIVMFFLGPDGEPRDDGRPPEGRTLGDLYRDWRSTLDAERGREDFHRRRPAARQVQGTGRPGRQGYRDEIVVTPGSSPIDAVTEAVHHDLFDPPIPRLRVNRASLETGRYQLTWRGELRVWPWRVRAVRIRLYASPSLNVTVVSLFPLKPRQIATRGFLRHGLRVMNRLRDRIDERVATAERSLADAGVAP